MSRFEIKVSEIHRANHRDHLVKLGLLHKLGSVEQDQMNLYRGCFMSLLSECSKRYYS